MRYFLDCEFIDNGKTIDLISIGVVCEDGREYYAINQACDYRKASQWVWNNVLYPMGFYTPLWCIEWNNSNEIKEARENKQYVKLPGLIAEELFTFLTENDTLPELWGYYSAYDHVAFCQLFGTMIDLPKGFPMYMRDLKQTIDEIRNPYIKEQSEMNHNALADARWIRDTYRHLSENYQHPAFRGEVDK